MPTLSLLWHLHQPGYRTADGTAHAPWVALHAGGTYRTLVDAIVETRAPGQVVNLVPSLVEQLEAYANGSVTDPVLEVLLRPIAELDRDARCRLADWAFHVAPRQMERLPRLEELAMRRRAAETPEALERSLGPAELRDLQVLTILAHAGDRAWRDPLLEPLFRRGRRFTPRHHSDAATWLERQPAELLERLRTLSDVPGVEIATSPFAHPIVPLLIGTSIVRESWAPEPAPEVPPFSRPGDAEHQIRTGLRFMEERGFRIEGCWPPEGSVSDDAVALYGRCGVRWLVTDEGILERSLGRPVRDASGGLPELYVPWRRGSDGPVILFRDRELSDRIGFVYGRFEDEAAAARDLVNRLRALSKRLGPEAAVVLALDGENPWPHYARAGGVFLRTLFDAVGRGETGMDAVPLAALADPERARPLPRLHPGSWIGGTFSTWIGHPEKSRAWALLAAVRDLLPDDPASLSRSMVLAEGSDWFWWLGDDNPTALAPLYDRIFRTHLADACREAGVEPPPELDAPLKPEIRPVRVPVSERWRTPVLDGRVTSYFEWSLAAWVEASGLRLGLWSDGRTLFLMLGDGDRMDAVLEGAPLEVELTSPDGTVTELAIGPGPGGSGAIRWAVGRVAEIAIPWDARDGWTLHLNLGEGRGAIPVRGVLGLEPWPVDEEL